MTKELAEKAVELFLKNILVHMLYMVDYKNSINLIFVSNNRIDDNVIIEIENEIEALIKKEVNILNAYDFDIADRMEIIKRAELLYCENKLIKQIFEIETATAMKATLDERSRFIERKTECATYYLQ